MVEKILYSDGGIMKKIIETQKAPSPIGPYSQAILANGFIFVSGQIPVDPITGIMASGGVAEQTRQVIKNIAAILESAGSGLEKIVKTTVFLADLEDFPSFNSVYAEFFSEDAPARATVEVARLPKNALVEIEVIAVV
jgi:2-iminobutanoate/2-iminopropanoate deaminase